VSDPLEQLDPRVVPLQQIQGSLFIGLVAAGSLVFTLVSIVADDDGFGAGHLVMLALWVVMVVLGMWFALTWPARAYRHTFYRVDDQGLEIRRGVFWRDILNVPRSRVQHIDVSQGPLERRYGLGTLVVYTAGTDHAKVELGGLEHGRAMQLRAQLLPSGAGDAI
jgi:membrane protein YdbS with pleckstrin-like domain